MGMWKLTSSAYCMMGNSDAESVNHTMAQMLSMVVNERQKDKDEQLSRVEAVFSSSVDTGTGLAPNEVHLGRLPRLPIIVIERPGASGHQSLRHDHLKYGDLARERQQLAY